MSLRIKELREFDVRDYLPEIAAAFDGTKGEYEKLIKGYHRVYLDKTRNEQFKREERAKTKNAVYDLVNKRAAKAKAMIGGIREKYLEPEPGPEIDASEKLFNLAWWKEILPEADYSKLQELYSRHNADEVFTWLLYRELERREKERPANFNLTKQQELMSEIEQGPELPGLRKLEIVINHVAATSREYFNPGIKEHIKSNGRGGLYPRNIDNDLNLYPISDGPTFRPVFSLPEHLGA